MRFDNKKTGEIVTFDTINQTGNQTKKRSQTAINKVKPGDKVIAYHSYHRITGVWAILEALSSKDNDQIKFKIIKKGKTTVDKKEIEENYGAEINLSSLIFKEINADIYEIANDLIEKEEAQIDNGQDQITIPQVDFEQQLEIENLYFPQEQKEKIITQVTTNLKQGKHIILTGPPGTGKSKLAEEICETYTGQHNMVTATADWSTFDTIGGYKPDENRQLSFNSGIFLDCFKKDGQLRNQWLVIDEINRADIDKAFGSLFSVLTGDAITLSFKAENGENLVVKPEDKTELGTVESQEYIVPNDWRLIATMNTFDKTSLYEMSYAFMRRFAFVPVTIPKTINAQLIAEYLKVWDIEDKSYIEEVAKLWKEINKTQKIGPAIVKDIYQYVAASQGDFVSSLMMYVLPQFEGLREQKLNDFINSVSQFDFIAEVDKNELRDFVADYFRLGV